MNTETDTRPSILVVEDEQLVAMYIRELLAEVGFEVHCLSEGEPTLQAVRRTGFAAVIIDVGLPDCQGDELAQQVRTECPTLPIILSTGYDPHPFEERFVGDSRVRVLPTPYDESRLLMQFDALAVTSRH